MSAGVWRGFWYVLGAVVVVAVGYAIGDSIPDAGNGDDHGDDDLTGLGGLFGACFALGWWAVCVCLIEVLLWARRLWVRRSQREHGRGAR